MLRLTKTIIINLLLFCIIVLIIETICFFGRLALDKANVGYIYRTDSQILAELPCVLMKTHPILGHIPDHKNKCDIKGGYAEDSYVLYGNKDKNIDRPAIITLGGSTTSGFYQHYAEGDTYPFLLSQLVKGEGYQIINGGHGGYSSSQELLKLSTEVRALKYKTPIIISLNGINDLYVPDHPNPFLDDRVQIMMDKQLWINQGFLPRFLPNIWSLINKFSPNLPESIKINNDSSIFQKLQPYEVWEKNIKAMHGISISMGTKYFTFLQPTMMLEGTQSQLSEDINSKDYEMVKAFKENFIWEEGYELGYVDLLRSNYKKILKFYSPTCRPFK
mgnify:CR=1 FL=1